MEEYLKLFLEKEDPSFLIPYMETRTIKRTMDVTQFCGCDYTNLYHPKFLYTRFDHSLVVANMTWHFTHDKIETIAAFFHDVGTPCFAHCIDYVLGDYMKQESSEKSVVDVIQKDPKLLRLLKEEKISLPQLQETMFPILESKHPKLCADRLDGVLHTCYIWLQTHSLEEIREVYDDIVVLTNEEGSPEIGFQTQEICEKFVEMVSMYAKELQGNRDKYVMKYTAEVVKSALAEGLFTLEDLYTEKESDLIAIFKRNYPSWKQFEDATSLICTEEKPKDHFSISFSTKKRNTIPLLKTESGVKRITEVSLKAQEKYEEIDAYRDTTYAYLEEIKQIQYVKSRDKI